MPPSDEIDPSSSVFHETLGISPSNNRLRGRKILVVGAGQREVIDEKPPIGNGRAISTLFAREGAAVVCLDVNKVKLCQSLEPFRNTLTRISGSRKGNCRSNPF